MKKAIKNLFLMGVGAAATATAVMNKDKIKKEVDKFVKMGKIKASEGKEILDSMVKDAKEAQKKLNQRVDVEVKKQVTKLGYVSKAVHKKLEEKNKKLEAEIKKLKEKSKPSKPKAPKKAVKAPVKKAVKPAPKKKPAAKPAKK